MSKNKSASPHYGPDTPCSHCGETIEPDAPAWTEYCELHADYRKKRDDAPIALAYDKTDDELVAKLYTLEVVAECEDAWWMRVARTEHYPDA